MKFPSKNKKKLSTLLHVERPRRLRPVFKKKSRTSVRAFSTSFNKHISKFTTPRFFLACLSITVFGVVVGILFFSKFFHISNIVVTRDAAYVNPQEIEQVLQIYKGRNILFLSEGEMKQELLEKFPMLSGVEVKKLYPQALQVKVASYPIFSRIRNEGLKKEYYLNSNGVIVQPDPNQKENNDLLLLTIPIYREIFEEFKEIIAPYIELKIGKKLFSKEQMLFLQKISDIYQKNFEGKIKGFIFFPIEKELHIELASGTKLYFAIERDLETQLYMLKSFTVDAKSNVLDSGDFAYIDLRIKDKIITCKKNDVCAAG